MLNKEKNSRFNILFNAKEPIMIKTQTLIFLVVITFSIITGFLLYQDYKVEETLVTKPVIDVIAIEKHGWEFKHCTPTNKNCGRLE